MGDLGRKPTIMPRGRYAVCRFLLLAILGISCAAAPPTPTDSTLPTTGSSFQSPSASVHAIGTVTFPSCASDGKCSYDFLERAVGSEERADGSGSRDGHRKRGADLERQHREDRRRADRGRLCTEPRA